MIGDALSWHDRREAARLIAQREGDAAAKPCAHCGGPVTVSLIDVSGFTEPGFVSGDARCVAECWRNDPDGYMATVIAVLTEHAKEAMERKRGQVMILERNDYQSRAPGRRWWRRMAG